MVQHTQQIAQFLFKLDDEIVAAQLLEGEVHLLADVAELLQTLAGPFDGVFVFIEQALDEKDELDVVEVVGAVAGAVFLGAQLGKLGFPITQNVGFERGDPADFADGVVEFFDFLVFHSVGRLASLPVCRFSLFLH